MQPQQSDVAAARPAPPEKLTATQARRVAARDSILRAARELIAEDGFAGAQVSLIAVRAGVGVGSIYKHFPSRAELFAEIYRDVAAREFARVKAAVAETDGGAGARIAAAVATFCTRALRGGRFAYALLVEHSEPDVDEHRLAFREGYRTLFREVLDQGIDDGEIPAQDTDTAAAALLGIMTETLVRPLADLDQKRDSQALIEQVVNLCSATVQARPPGRSDT
ncbi:TetR/AcrR family transcriptional regulator [Pseudonocardia alaniniphila]|uniref:TetR/AcrR family transcriptional regulator n=1 Tax=Pseudonocardia alaniniphila TaxID=75291 RepID=A0ABS9TTV7_9PSEU|nr:TetR/AcrR family transcriptional regulator [Pseudonocardia alaniniphila]MCH6171926.1 TetR/AcrR family transcriptional regulator [Pseudonocardia alaniniphila]